MPQWLPHRLVVGAPKPSHREAAVGEILCANCSRPFPLSDLLRFEDNYICAECKPVYFQRVFEGLGGSPIAAWHSGKFLITKKGARLPDRCLKCNRPANDRNILKKLQWQPPWVYIPLALVPVLWVGFGVLIAFFAKGSRQLPMWIGSTGGIGFFVFLAVFAVLSTITRHRAEVRVPLCARHFRDHYISMAVIVSLWIAGIAGLLIAVSMFNTPGIIIGLFVGVIILGAAAAIYSTVRVRLISVKRMTREFIWLRGASKQFLADLPEWDGRG